MVTWRTKQASICDSFVSNRRPNLMAFRIILNNSFRTLHLVWNKVMKNNKEVMSTKIIKTTFFLQFSFIS